jgi:hypothetical protein
MLLYFNDLKVAQRIKYSTCYLHAVWMHRRRAHKLLSPSKKAAFKFEPDEIRQQVCSPSFQNQAHVHIDAFGEYGH